MPTAAYTPFTHTTHTPDPHFTGLLAQTRSYLLSPDFALVLEAALVRATECGWMNDGTVMGGGDEARGGDTGEDGYSQLQRESAREKEEVKVRLVGLLPGLAKWSQLALNGLLNELIDIIWPCGRVSCSELARLFFPFAFGGPAVFHASLGASIIGTREVSGLEAIVISDYQDRFPGQ
ncbi:hypothetical protein BV22DRAFT_1050594 [Leucogyrophana mollusca]|uniref:Uncharacterized protein n=1 Tax=Leucogyrophana mollusca TaxID=85980 RepID=A0ACB8B3I9_9AGAM|nr:hypothetical protein BV22DRAFT_1050594 [Leucogyrophana mollusca]